MTEFSRFLDSLVRKQISLFSLGIDDCLDPYLY